MVVQTNDGNLCHHRSSFLADDKFTTINGFNEEVNNILFPGTYYYFLIVGKNNVYIAKLNNNTYDLIKMDSLKKYRNDIRSFYMNNGIGYVLLSDGNLYKVY